jgi:hypothetical protein
MDIKLRAISCQRVVFSRFTERNIKKTATCGCLAVITDTLHYRMFAAPELDHFGVLKSSNRPMRLRIFASLKLILSNRLRLTSFPGTTRVSNQSRIVFPILCTTLPTSAFMRYQ